MASIDTAPAPSSSGAHLAPASGGYRIYLLFLCCFSFFVAGVDRQVFATVMPALKGEFQLSDTMLGLLSGLGFGLTYSLFSIPMGRLVDRANRKLILCGCVGLWSAMTFACGAAASAVQLMIARLGVGAGEAGVSPAAVSMIVDLYEPQKRARAVAFYPIAGALGMSAALPVGGYIVANHGWRSAFYILSIPGLLLALVIYFTFREPRRGAHDAPQTEEVDTSLLASIAAVVGQPVIMLLFLAGGLGSMVTAIAHWLPSFYQRSHGMDLAQLGAILGPVVGVASLTGMYLGGWLVDRVGGEGRMHRTFFVLALTSLAQALSGTLMLAADNLVLSFTCAAIWGVASTCWAPAGFALSQSLVRPNVRGTSLAIMNIFNNVVGYGLGPLVMGALSEEMKGDTGVQSLRWSLVAVSAVLGVLIAVIYVCTGLLQRRRQGAIPKA